MSDRRAEVLAAVGAMERAATDEALRALARRVRARIESDASVAVAVIGRRGAGKTSLVDALVRATSAASGATVRARSAPSLGVILLDAPGFRGREAAWPEIASELRAWTPAATLFVCSATEVDALGDDLVLLSDFLRAQPAPRRCVVAVNKVDELDPVDVHLPPFLHPRKGFHIAEACARARMNLSRRGVTCIDVVPVSALVVRDGGRVLHDGRWNVDRVGDALRSVAAECGALGRLALRADVRALARSWANYASTRLSGAEREAGITVLSRLVGRDARDPGWSRPVLAALRGDALHRLARSSPDLGWIEGQRTGS